MLFYTPLFVTVNICTINFKIFFTSNLGTWHLTVGCHFIKTYTCHIYSLHYTLFYYLTPFATYFQLSLLSHHYYFFSSSFIHISIAFCYFYSFLLGLSPVFNSCYVTCLLVLRIDTIILLLYHSPISHFIHLLLYRGFYYIVTLDVIYSYSNSSIIRINNC